MVSREQPDLLIGARYGGGPLIVGLGENEQFLASDIPPFSNIRAACIIVEEGEMVASAHRWRFSQRTRWHAVQREPLTIDWNAEAAEKGGYPHFALKEINEQPDAIRRALLGRVRDGQLHLGELQHIQQAGLLDKMQRISDCRLRDVVSCRT